VVVSPLVSPLLPLVPLLLSVPVPVDGSVVGPLVPVDGSLVLVPPVGSTVVLDPVVLVVIAALDSPWLELPLLPPLLPSVVMAVSSPHPTRASVERSVRPEKSERR